MIPFGWVWPFVLGMWPLIWAAGHLLWWLGERHDA